MTITDIGAPSAPANEPTHNTGPGLTRDQVDALCAPVHPGRVLTDNKGMAYLPAFDISANLNRIFGFAGWDKVILSLECIAEDAEERGGRIGWTVTYRCTLRLVIRDTTGAVVKISEEGACGSANNQPSHADAHDLAAKNAISYAQKRAAKDLGDQFGLSLYNKGATAGVSGTTLVGGSGAPTRPAVRPAPMNARPAPEPVAPARVERRAGSVVSVAPVRRAPPARPRRAGEA